MAGGGAGPPIVRPVRRMIPSEAGAAQRLSWVASSPGRGLFAKVLSERKGGKGVKRGGAFSGEASPGQVGEQSILKCRNEAFASVISEPARRFTPVLRGGCQHRRICFPPPARHLLSFQWRLIAFKHTHSFKLLSASPSPPLPSRVILYLFVSVHSNAGASQ